LWQLYDDILESGELSANLRFGAMRRVQICIQSLSWRDAYVALLSGTSSCNATSLRVRCCPCANFVELQDLIRHTLCYCTRWLRLSIFNVSLVSVDVCTTLYIQGVYKRMMRFQKLTTNLFLTLHGQNVHRQQRQLSKFFKH
jgi:hypothetical protein